MLYDKEQIDEMCNKVDLLEYASQSLDFKRSGTNYFAHCPLHRDDTASLSITPDKNKFYCFSCHKGGGIINWLMSYEGLTYLQAVEKVAKLTGTELTQHKRCTSFGVFKKIAKINEVEESKSVDRKILDTSYMDRFKVIDGEPHEWIEEGILPEVMKEFDIRIDSASNRIVYPVYDNDDHLIGAKGRTRFKAYKTLGIMKYMNYEKVGTTDYFQGMHENREAIKETKSVIILEGIKSVMKLYGWGYRNAVAAETSHLNKAQVEILIRMGLRDVTIAFDSDVNIDSILDSVAELRRFCNVYYIKDKSVDPSEKASPCDFGKERWDQLYKERKRL